MADFEVAMDVESGIMLPVATEGDKMAVVPRSGKPEGGESGTLRFGVFFADKKFRYNNLVAAVCLVVITFFRHEVLSLDEITYLDQGGASGLKK